MAARPPARKTGPSRPGLGWSQIWPPWTAWVRGRTLPPMTASAVAIRSPRTPSSRSAWRWTGLAFVYWLVCMTVLEPGNVAGALDAGVRPHWGSEALRLVVAGLLGAAATPALLLLAECFPLQGRARWRHVALQGAGLALLALGLILVSCVLAAWMLRRELAPRLADINRELFANGLLVLLCLSGFLAIVQIAARLSRSTLMSGAAPSEGAWPAHLPIKDRGRLIVLDLAAVDWIESQGNYQALHAGDGVHLIRETSASLAARLDPARFVRIHRRTLVALDRVRQIEPLANGDAIVRLTTGAELRLARGHRDGLRRRLD
jgi:two-component system LytT family response regulator